MESLREIIDRVLPLLSYDPQAPMLFSSGLFLFLFAAFAFFYGFMRRTPALRIWYVIAFSLYFYYKSSGIYLLLLVGVSVSDFWIGRAIAHVSSRRAQRALVALSIAADLAVLGYFKYTNFFIEIARDLFGAGFLEFQNIFLPVGISFFLFQSLSYTIDIYRGSLKPVDRWGDYLFYLSFFPQLVAGPIVRARDFLVQIRQNPITVSREMFGTGIYLIAIGLFKKAVSLGLYLAQLRRPHFRRPCALSGHGVSGSRLRLCPSNLLRLLGLFGHGHRPGTAAGLPLAEEASTPPDHSATITEFWRRWHISLSMWLRDYLYISLGGNRKGRLRTYFNLLVTMVLGGAAARRGDPLRAVGDAARRSAGAAQALALGRPRRQSLGIPDAPAQPTGRYPRDFPPGLLRLAALPRRFECAPCSRCSDRDHSIISTCSCCPGCSRRLRRRLRPRGAGLSAAHAARPRRRRGTPRGGRLALLGAGVAARLRGMGRHADPVEQHPTLHLLPILILR